MSREEQYNWAEVIPNLPKDVTKPLEILSEGGNSPVSLEEINMDILGEEGKQAIEALMPIIIDWLNGPIFIDEFETSTDRSVWEDHVDTYGKDSVEYKFRRNNRIRINNMGRIIQNLELFIMFDKQDKAFTPEEKVSLKAKIKILFKKTHTVGKFLCNRYQTSIELREALSGDPYIFIEDEDLAQVEGDKAPLKIIQDLLTGMCSELEEITLNMLNKLKK